MFHWSALGRSGPMVAMVLLSGCRQVDELSDRLLDRRPRRERYLAAVERAGLANTALAQDWRRAADLAHRSAPVISAPHREDVLLSSTEPAALGLKLLLRRGQLVQFRLTQVGDSGTAIFLDVWGLDSLGALGPHIAESPEGAYDLEFEPPDDGLYLFLAQPELLRGGRFAVTLTLAPTLAFPVSGRGEANILSKWGAPRDGGRRRHEGVDIFAPKGTPTVAAAAGEVVDVGVNELGGKVIWLRDERGNTLYYAHLAEQHVANGDRVQPGDTIGTVGNTGNARTTPPHLHFGVYRRQIGPLDPWWFLHRPPGTLGRPGADTALLGGHVVAGTATALLRQAPANRADTIGRLSQTTPARVLAVVSPGWVRVQLDNGVAAFVGSRTVRRTPFVERIDRHGTGVMAAGAP